MSKNPEQSLFDYHITDKGHFIIRNYNLSPAFASFMPGIAGIYGIPMWVFYANRGQCISSFGIDNKDKAILEFFSADRAYQLTPTVGFRTFFKINGKDFYEPLQKPKIKELEAIHQDMDISSYGLSLKEKNDTLGITTNVDYFTVPNEPVGVFGRKVTITNNGSKPIDLEILDGLPQVVTSGLNHFLLKNLTNLTEAWALVEGVKERTPFYKIKVAVNDSPIVEMVKTGNFYFSKMLDGKELSEMIIDPRLIFGSDEAFLYPENFMNASDFTVPAEQRNMNLFPCAFSYNKRTVKPGEEISFVSFCGNARNTEILDSFKSKCKNIARYAEEKIAENEEVILRIEDDVMTLSSDKKFDYYTRQTYLDNVLRGGQPYTIGEGENQALLYLYSRKHGDMERDYNFFKIPATYYSTGNGNYRDVNQNRRNDININPDVRNNTLKTFMNLIQLDGYNPLVINGTQFFIENESVIKDLFSKHIKGTSIKLAEMLKNGYTPGEVFLVLDEEKLGIKTGRDELITALVNASEKYENADHSEGFWTDHWTYNLDLLESYLSIYPEYTKSILLDDQTFTFYDNFSRVVPRSEKYFLTPEGIRQYHSVAEDKKRHKELLAREKNPFAVRTKNGKGEVYQTNLLAKLIILAVNKAAVLDPNGVGIEFEANKPNWYDALNGISGLLGSSICETFELKRLVQMIKDLITGLKLPETTEVKLPAEAAEFFNEITAVFSEKKLTNFVHWDRRHTLLESYRSLIIEGIEGTEKKITFSSILHFADLLLDKLEEGIKKGTDKKTGLPFSYFINEVTDFEKLDTTGNGNMSHVKAKSFKQKPLALFLEGIVHGMRSENNLKNIQLMHKAVLTSDLFDKKLKMFKDNASLDKEVYEIGRCKAFPSGWLENESIWLHMEYKYLLELLKKGLYTEFFSAAKDALVPNIDPYLYGRSILENSSFIVSSSYFDETRHGRGCYARLSGSTAEFINMWLIMTIGKAPFQLDDKGQLILKFQPAIPGEMFTTKAEELNFFDKKGRRTQLNVPKNSFVFKLLGAIPVIYVNPKRLDTWTVEAKIHRIAIYGSNGENQTEVHDDFLSKDWATKVRNREVSKIEVYIG